MKWTLRLLIVGNILMHLESRNYSASILRFSEYITIHRDHLESILSLCFWNNVILLASCSLHTFREPKIIIHKVRKVWSELQGYSRWAVFTLISYHKSILSRGVITFNCTSALLRERMSVRLKSRLERHLLLKTKLRIDYRDNRDAFVIDPWVAMHWFIMTALINNFLIA